LGLDARRGSTLSFNSSYDEVEAADDDARVAVETERKAAAAVA